MSEALIPSAKIMVFGEQSEPISVLLADLEGEAIECSSYRRFKKIIRDESIGVLLCTITSEEDEELAVKLFDYLRNGLQDQDRIILVVVTPDIEFKALQWIEDFNVNGFINVDSDRQPFNKTLIQRYMQHWQRTLHRNAQHNAEKDLLMCVTRFSKYSENLQNLVDTFTQCLAGVSFASGYCRILIGSDGQGKIKSSWPDKQAFSDCLSEAFNLPELPNYLRRALVEKKPQIDLLADDHKLTVSGELLETRLGSYLVFPIVVYERVYELMVFLIPEVHMASVSMRQIDVISKASEQLTMLLERREAERRLKKQYGRLKNTLVELKETQEQLAYSEKMSTVGQLAAGIAHEINSPLGFVLSNFGSIDEYFRSIVDLQNMHERFINAIDNESKANIEQLKSEITDFRLKSDIDFIYSDIRDIVRESRDGLNRVKEIIADLQSFAHAGETQSTDIDLGH